MGMRKPLERMAKDFLKRTQEEEIRKIKDKIRGIAINLSLKNLINLQRIIYTSRESMVYKTLENECDMKLRMDSGKIVYYFYKNEEGGNFIYRLNLTD